MKTRYYFALALTASLAACSKAPAPQWERITQEGACNPAAATPGAPVVGCSGSVFYLDTAGVARKNGVLYVTFQTRAQGAGTDGAFGIIHAEANCAHNKLEPTALHEDLFGAGGAAAGSRMTTISAADEAAVLHRVCAAK